MSAHMDATVKDEGFTVYILNIWWLWAAFCIISGIKFIYDNELRKNSYTGAFCKESVRQRRVHISLASLLTATYTTDLSLATDNPRSRNIPPSSPPVYPPFLVCILIINIIFPISILFPHPSFTTKQYVSQPFNSLSPPPFSFE